MDVQGSTSDFELDVVSPAQEAQLPSTPWLSLRERVQRRGLQTLRREALEAIAALLLSHEIGLSVLGERYSEAVETGASERLCRELGEQTEGWAQDAALLRGVFAQVRTLHGPEEPVINHLRLSADESDLIQEVIGHVEAQVHRMLAVDKATQSRG